MQVTAPAAASRVEPGTVDLCDPGVFTGGCQHATWRTLRHEAPVREERAANGAAFWSVTRHADCARIVRDHEAFGSEDGTILASVGVGDAAGGLTITLTDPPRHGDIRSPSARTLGQSAIKRRTDRIEERATALMAPLLDGEVHDVAKVLRVFPLFTIGDLIGVPESQWASIAYAATASIAPSDPEFAMAPNAAGTLRLAHHELFTCFDELVKARRAAPSDDLISMLTTIEVDGRRMDDRRIALNCYNFLLGASSTTPHVATHALLALAENPDAWRRVREDPALVGGLVEEAARWASPTHHLVRRALVATTLHGQAIQPGDWVCAWIASANRDEDVFDDPYRFDPARSPNPHLSFGAGPHFCIGASGARRALAAMFAQLAQRVASLEVVGEVRHLYSNWINGITSLPMRMNVAP